MSAKVYPLGTAWEGKEPVLTVLNRRHCQPSDWDIYAGRPSILGNPFTVGKLGRDACVEQYEAYAWERMKHDLEFRAALLACESKRVACWCYPLNCHVNAIARLIVRWKAEHP